MSEVFRHAWDVAKRSIGLDTSHEQLTTAAVTSLEEKRQLRAARQRYSKRLTPAVRAWLLAAGLSLPVRVVSPLFVWAKPRIIENSTVEEVAPGVWIFESGDAKQPPFKVQRVGSVWTCGCAKWQKQRGHDCQHIAFIKGSDDSTSTPYRHSRRVALPRIIYPEDTPTEATRRQNARAKQCDRVTEMLGELHRLSEPIETAGRERGRPPVNPAARAYALVIKALLGGSSYNQVIDYLKKDPHAPAVFKTTKLHRNSLCAWAADPEVTSVLRSMSRRIVSTVRDIETVAVIDGTGRAVTQTGDYFEAKYGRPSKVRKKAEFLKEHLLVGRRTGIHLSVEFSLSYGRGSADAVHLRTTGEKALAVCTSLAMIVGDKSYGTTGNGHWCEQYNILLVTRAKSNETRASKKWSDAQRQLAKLEREHPQEFAHLFYDQRSIVEAAPARSKRNQRSRRLRRRVTDPIVAISDANDQEQAALTALPQEKLREIVDLQEQALGVGRLNEGLAIVLRDDLCTLPVLEELYDQKVRFVPGFTFHPIATKELANESELDIWPNDAKTA